MSASTSEVVPSAPLAAWQAHLRAGRFMLQQCGACQRFIFYPRVICHHCGGEQLSWKPAGQAGGTVYSSTIVARREKDGGPYNVVLVDLDEGVRMMSRVEGVAPDAVQIGQRVRAYIGAIEDEPVVLFTPS